MPFAFLNDTRAKRPGDTAQRRYLKHNSEFADLKLVEEHGPRHMHMAEWICGWRLGLRTDGLGEEMADRHGDNGHGDEQRPHIVRRP